MGSSVLLIGPSFTGKTRAQGTWPGRVLGLSFEHEGYQALRVPYCVYPTLRSFWAELAAGKAFRVELIRGSGGVETTVSKEPPKVIMINYFALPKKIGTTALPDFSTAVLHALMEDINSLEDGHMDFFQASFLDSLSPFADEVLRWQVAINSRRKVEIQDYNFAIAKLKEILFAVIGTGMNFCLIAHYQMEKDEISGRVRQTPQVWGKSLPADVQKWFSNQLETTTITGPSGLSYKWLTRPEGLVQAMGSRLHDNLPRLIEPDFGKFLRGEYK